MSPGDIVTISPPFGDGATPWVVSGVIDANTSYVEQGGDHLAFGNDLLTVVGTGGVFNPPPAADPSAWHITKLAFRNRFTQAEKVSIEIAGLDNPAAPMAQRAQQAALRAYQADLAVATFVDLQRPDTRSGVHALEAATLLSVGRAAEILDALPSESERYHA